MPLIQPPNDYGQPPVDDQIEEIRLSVQEQWERNRRIEIFLNIKPWLCPVCGITNFGRNRQCARWTCKTPRPADFKFEKKDG